MRDSGDLLLYLYDGKNKTLQEEGNSSSQL